MCVYGGELSQTSYLLQKRIVIYKALLNFRNVKVPTNQPTNKTKRVTNEIFVLFQIIAYIPDGLQNRIQFTYTNKGMLKVQFAFF